MKFHMFIIVLLFVVGLTACGGGGSGNDASGQTGNQIQPGETIINGKA